MADGIVRHVGATGSLPFGAAKPLEHHVHGQAMQPGAQRALAAEPREPLPGAHEPVLQQPGRLVVAAEHAPADRVGRRRMDAIERLERPDVALLRAAHQVVAIGGLAHPGNDSLHRGCSHAHRRLARYRRAAALSVESISLSLTARGRSTPDACCVGTRTPSTRPSPASETMAVVLCIETRSSHVPSAGHCRRTANTPGTGVVSRRSGIVRRAPLTIPSALPVSADTAGGPSRVMA